jgi:TatD DNase family protein
VVDNHVHLDIARDGEQAPAPDEAIAAASAVGVPRLVQVGCDPSGVRFTGEVVEKYAAMLGGVAVHPNTAPRLAGTGALDDALAEVEHLATHPRIRVVGETGLDYFRTGPEDIPLQQKVFRWHIDLAKRTGRALQIHDRDAHDDVLRILDEEGPPTHTVLHCFSGDVGMARTAVERGYFLSFAGTVTFKNASALRDALAVTPLDNLLVETDAPYLAPTPHRGATNASYLVPLTVRAMAGVLNVDVPTLCTALSANSDRVYGSWQADAPIGT